ncbi:MAG: protein-L-isoaspartate(D-aspartate) O-methyltransferase [bacterium]|nr:protein-L-isoaspartate(D-aspartate) O-methyltransferase [bacterium]
MTPPGLLTALLALVPVLSPPPAPPEGADATAEARRRMVEHQIRDRGIADPAVLRAMGEVPRHLFVPPALVRHAYDDRPLPIGHGQTISQPYIVALMAEMLRLPPRGARVLEIGTGSGYHAAVLAGIAEEVYTVEIIPALALTASARLRELGYKNVRVRDGDGYHGWEEHAPFDGIVVTAAAAHIPPPLIEQLKEGGRMAIPVGSVFFAQYLMLVEKRDGRVTTERVIPVRFVPLTGGPPR